MHVWVEVRQNHRKYASMGAVEGDGSPDCTAALVRACGRQELQHTWVADWIAAPMPYSTCCCLNQRTAALVNTRLGQRRVASINTQPP